MSTQLDWFVSNLPWIVQLTVDHLLLSALPVVIALLIAVPLGWLAHRMRAARVVVIAGAGLLYTIPSLALFVLLPVVLGTRILDPVNVVVALTIYSVALLVRTVVDGLDSVPDDAVQAATGMGYTALQRLRHVQLPVAVPVIGAGLRVAVVANVSGVAIAALIGIPQLGSLFTAGFQVRQFLPVVLGIVLCALIAVVLDAIVQFGVRRLTPWARPRGTAA